MLFITISLIAFAVALYWYWTWNFKHWQRRGLIGPQPQLFVGNYPNSMSQKRHMAYDVDDIYRNYKEQADFVGIYSGHAPSLLVTSPALIHKVFVNDFRYFHDNELSEMITDKSDFIIANNAFSLTGAKWKEQRAESSPGLAMSRLKTLFPVTQKYCQRMLEFVKEQSRVPSKDGIDTGDLCLRFTSDLVTDWTLGLDAASFSANPTPIMANIQNLFHMSPRVMIYFLANSIFPKLRKVWKVRLVPKAVEDFFVALTEDALKIRHNENDVKRSDYLSYLLQVQGKKNLSALQLTAHSMTFLLDGFETTATVMSHTLLLLARKIETQMKLREEILQNFGETGEIDVDVLNQMPYLDACIHEALRMFPPIFVSSKLCTESIEWTNKNGSSLLVNKGEVIVLPLYSVMKDPDYYPEPEEFVPERFLEENGGVKKYREMGVYFGFGDGPRICLGMRFALVNIKAALVAIIRTFDVSVNPRTRNDNQYDPKHFVTRLDGGIFLDYKSRK